MNINEIAGIQPRTREIVGQMAKGMSGDIVLSVSPETAANSAAAVNTAIAGDGFTRRVTLELVDSDGKKHEWSSDEFSIIASEATAGDGVATIVNSLSAIGLTNGKATVDLSYSGTWAESDTATLTVKGKDVCGKTIADKTSVDTLTA